MPTSIKKKVAKKVTKKVAKKVLKKTGPMVIGIAHHSPLDVLPFVPESSGFQYARGVRNIKGEKVLCFADATELKKAQIEILDEKNSKPRELSPEIFTKRLGSK